MSNLEDLLGAVGNESYDPSIQHIIGDADIAIEAISAQKKNKFKRLESLISGLRTMSSTEKEVGDELSDLFNMDITFAVTKDTYLNANYNGSVYRNTQSAWTDSHDVSEVFTRIFRDPGSYDQIATDFFEDAGKLTRELRKNKGTIDLKNAKVGGAFSKSPVLITITRGLLNTKGIPVSNIAAVILHEVGHAFDEFQYAHRMTRVNLLMAEVSNNFKAGAKDTMSLKVMEEGVKAGLIKETAMKDIESGTTMLLPFAYMRAFSDSFASISGSFASDLTNSESSADNFAVKCGYGPELIDMFTTTLSQESNLKESVADIGNGIMITLMLSMEAYSNILMSLMLGYLVKSTFIIVAPFYKLLYVVITIFWIIYLISWIVGLIGAIGGSGKGAKGFKDSKNAYGWDIYDMHPVRLKRMKDGIVKYLKENRGKITKSNADMIQSQINAADKVINLLKDSPKLTKTLEVIYDSVIGSKSEKDKMVKRDLLEEIMNNEAFVAGIEAELIGAKI